MAVVNRKDHLADRFREIERRLRVLELGGRFQFPEYAADPTTPVESDVWINTTSGQVKAVVGGSIAVLTTVPVPWTAPTLLNSWVNFDPVNFTPAGYMRDSAGNVRLRGLIKNGVSTAGTTLFVLPAGFRPSRVSIFAVSSNDAFGEVRVDASGNVNINVGSSSWIALDNISFQP